MLVEAVFEIAQQHTEAVGDAFIEAGALSVSIEDADQHTPDEQALFGEPGLTPPQHAWQRNHLIVLIDGQSNVAKYVAELIQAAQALCLTAIPLPLEVRGLDEQEWVSVTQAQFAPINIGRLWVVPSWHDVPSNAEIAIRLDPGMAFGTGSHPTTHLCLQWLEQHLAAGSTVLDYGCGSGILSIAAKKLGADTTVGLDIDANAVIAAQQNATANQISAHFVAANSAIELKQFDCVVANILSNPLKVLAPVLVAYVRPQGRMILSGILERQASEVAAVYAEYGMPMEVAARLDGWVVLENRVLEN